MRVPARTLTVLIFGLGGCLRMVDFEEQADPKQPDPCPSGQCVGFCVDLSVDPSNCGACGYACALGEACVGGQCTCVLAHCFSGCSDLMTDSQNCGSCENVCPWGQACYDGECDCVDTWLTPCSGKCVDLDEDEKNCGACDNPCPSGDHCTAGFCI